MAGKQRAYVDAATGLRLLFEPEEHDPERLTIFAEDAKVNELSDEHIHAAIYRLVQAHKAMIQEQVKPESEGAL